MTFLIGEKVADSRISGIAFGAAIEEAIIGGIGLYFLGRFRTNEGGGLLIFEHLTIYFIKVFEDNFFNLKDFLLCFFWLKSGLVLLFLSLDFT